MRTLYILLLTLVVAVSAKGSKKSVLQRNIEETYKRVDYMMMVGSDGEMHTTIVYVSSSYSKNPRAVVEYDSTVDEAFFRPLVVNCEEKTVTLLPAGGVYMNSKLERSDMDLFNGKSPRGSYYESGEYPYYVGENPLVGIPCKLKPKFKHLR